MHRSAALVAALAVSCSSSVTPTNPYDPETPPDQQAKAQLRGTVLASGGDALSGATVVLRQNGRTVQQTTTVAGGGFLFDAVVPGVYLFELGPVGFVPVSMTLTLRPGEDLQLGEIAVTAAASASALEGVATLTGSADHGGTLVEAVGRAYTAMTNSQGQFRLDVAEGTYTLRMSHAGFLPATVQDVTVSRGATLILDPVALAANPGTIAGHVDAELAAGGFGPLADVVVTVEGTSLTGFTNAAGDFALTSVPPGSYLLRLFKDGYGEVLEPVLDLQGGELRRLADPVELPLSRGGLAGVVSLADKPGDASGVVVEVAGTTRATVTGSDGAYAFDGLLEGPYALSAHKDGYAPRDLRSWTVTAGTVTRVGAAVLTPQGGAVAVIEGAWVNTRAIHLAGAAGAAGFYKASEDPALPGAWGAIPASGQVPFTLSDRDGAHTVWFVYSADGQTAGAPASAEVVLDRQRPSSPAVAVGDGTGWTRAPGGIVSLSLSALDLPPTAGAAVSGVLRMQLSSDAAFAISETRDYALTTTWTLAAPATDGPKAVYVRFLDRAGNVSDVASAQATLDRIAPANPALALAGPAPSPAGLSTSPVVAATLSATDAHGPLAVRLSNTPGFEGARYQPLSSPASWTLLPGDGAKTVYAQFLDPAGNESLAVPASITLDTSGPFNPVVAILESDARPTDGYTSVLGVTVSLSAGGAPTAAQVSEDPAFAAGVTVVQMGGLPQPVSTPFTLGGSGPRTIYARFQDAAGNWSAAASARVTVDATRPATPTLTVRASLADGTPSGSLAAQSVIVLGLELPGSDDAVEMATAQGAGACGSTWAATWYPLAASAVMLLDPPDGAKTVCVRTRDRAGNESRIAAASLELDTTPPTNPAFRDLASTITHAARVSGTLITASIDPPHEPASVAYQCFTSEAGVWGVCTGAAPTFDFALQRNQPNVVGIRARDAAGNVSSGTLVSVVQDDTAPLPPNITDVQTTADSVTVAWAPSADTDLDHFLVSYGTYSGDFAGTGAAQGGSPVFVAAKGGVQSFTLTGLDTGRVYYVAIEAVDRAGNGSGPSGQRVAAPNRVNPRLVASYGAKATQVAALVDGARTFAYVATNQGVIQLDATSTETAPSVIGRATVPDVVPDVPPLAFPCRHGGASGHCVVLAGSTLEGAALRSATQDRAFAPVVWFPLTGTSSAPAIGSLVSQLPSRPHRLVEQDGADGPLVYSVEPGRVVAFSLATPSFPRTLAAAALPKPLTSVVEAAVRGDSLWVYGPIVDASQPGYRLQRVGITTAPQLALAATDLGTLLAEDGRRLGTPGDEALAARATFRNGLYVAYTIVNSPGYGAPNTYQVSLCRYLPTDTSPHGCARFSPYGTPSYFPSFAFTANGYVDVVVGGRVYPSPQGHLVFRAYVGDEQLPQPVSASAVAHSTSEAYVLAAADATSSTDALERLLVLGQGMGSNVGAALLERWVWSGSGSAAPAAAPAFTYAEPHLFAEWDRFLYAVHGASVDVLDYSNPLAPVLASSVTRPGREYERVLASAGYLFAADDEAIDVYRMDGQGHLTLERSLALPISWTPSAMVVQDWYLFVPLTNQILVWDLFDLSGAPFQRSSLPYQDSIAVVSRTSVPGFPTTVYTTDGDQRFQAYAFNGGVLTPIGGSVPLPARGETLNVAGPLAAVSTVSGAMTIDLSSVAAPEVKQDGIRLTAGILQGGYLVGEALFGEHGGPLFDAYASGGGVQGYLPYSTCAYGSLLHRDGAYLAACTDDGIALVSGADGRHVRLLGSHDLGMRWDGAGLVVDGHDAYVAGAAAADPYPLYTASAEGLAAGVADRPVVTGTDAVPHRYPQWMLAREGLIWSFEWNPDTSRASIVSYESASPLGGWPVRSSADLPGTLGFGAQPVTDGRLAYVVRWGPLGNLSGATAEVEAYDVRTPSSVPATPVATWAFPALGDSRAMALARERLYVAHRTYPGSPAIQVFDTHDPFTSGLPPLTPVFVSEPEPMNPTNVTGIAVSGSWLIYTFWRDAQPNTYGLRVVRLGPNRDGAGAVVLGEVTSRYPLSSPVVSGDRLFVASNLGVATYDLDPLYRYSHMPAPLQAVAPIDVPNPYWNLRLVVDGPFAYLAGATYRVYDLR